MIRYHVAVSRDNSGKARLIGLSRIMPAREIENFFQLYPGVTFKVTTLMDEGTYQKRNAERYQRILGRSSNSV